MTIPYREQLLTALADGEWHAAAELAHPAFPREGLDAFVRILRAEGYRIEERSEGATRAYQLDPRSPG
jgi:hypothetical protein